ncbi:kinase [Thraustotheca clavata]|uniref:Kinase n=1 Tax=Thraustotheca clavata TaxID=74557 RepID=A0A1W0AA49_9STRA|nr:kinase [Thraustotheca clavata]
MSSACNDAVAAFTSDRRACLLSTKAATNATLYCSEPSCVSQLQTLQTALKNNCSVATSDIPMVLGTQISPLFCQSNCVAAFNTMQSSLAKCQQSGVKTAPQCQACAQYKQTVPVLVEACAYNATIPSLLASVATDLSVCDTSVQNQATNSSSPSPIIYWALGSLFVCIIIGVAVFLRLKRKGGTKDLSYYRKHGQKRKVASNRKNFFLDNDVRLDPTMVDFIYDQEQLSQITLKSKGGFGLVYSAYLATSTESIRVALKQILPEKTTDIDQLESFMNEIRMAARLNHPNIVRFIGITWSSLEDLSMMTEYMSRGDLNKFLRHEYKQPSTTFSWTTEHSCNKLGIAGNVIDALVYLHGSNPTAIIHRDLKAKNVLLTENFVAQLTDFGVSRESAEDGDAIMTARVGTSAWIAPEILRGEKYTIQADIYSFGVLLAELDTLQVPYSNPALQPEIEGLSPGQLSNKVAHGKIQPAFTKQVPTAIHSIAKRCMQYKDTRRPTASQIAIEIHSLLLRDGERLSGPFANYQGQKSK